MLAQIKYHYKLTDLSGYTDNEIINLFAELEWIRKEEAKELKNTIYGG